MGIFETVDTYRSIAFAYLSNFVHSVVEVVRLSQEFIEFIPPSFQILASTLLTIAIARLCISLGGH